MVLKKAEDLECGGKMSDLRIFTIYTSDDFYTIKATRFYKEDNCIVFVKDKEEYNRTITTWVGIVPIEAIEFIVDDKYEVRAND